jgi:hypothetical protein
VEPTATEVDITATTDPLLGGFDVRVAVGRAVFRWHAETATQVEPVGKDLAAAALNRPAQQVRALVHWPSSLDGIQAQLDVIYERLRNVENRLRPEW